MKNFIARLDNNSFENEFEFKSALLEELGLTNDPKADELYELAWEEGHAYGYSEVYSCACDMIES